MDKKLAALKHKFKLEPNIEKRIDMINEKAFEEKRSNSMIAYELATEASELAHLNHYHKGICDSMICLASLDSQSGRILESIEMLNKALAMCEQIGHLDGTLRILNSLGYNYSQMGRKDKSLEYYLQGLTLAKQTENKDNRIIFLLNNIGEQYKFNMNMYEEALKYYVEAVDYCKAINSPYIWFIYNNIGETYLLMDNIEKALEYTMMSLDGTTNINDKLTEAQSCKFLGRIYLRLGRQQQALEYFQQSLDLYRKIGNRIGETDILTDTGMYYNEIGDYSKALEYMLDALQLTEDMHTDTYLESINKTLAEIYEKTCQYEKSIFHYKKYIQLNQAEATLNLEKRLNAFMIESKIKQAEQETEIYKLKNIELREKSDELERNAKKLEDAYKNMSVISEIGQKITASLDIETVMTTIYESINLLMDANGFGIGLYDEENGNVDYKIFIENGRRLPRFVTPIDVENSLASKCIITKKEIVLNFEQSQQVTQIMIPDDSEDADDTTPLSIIYYPLIIEGSVVGALTVQSYQQNAYTDHHLDTIKALASYIVTAINNSQKSEDLKKTAEELQETLKNLQEAQEYLIVSEKMVALGQLISGIAHEINTPLGAIQASLNNITEYMEHTIGGKLPRLFEMLDTKHQTIFFDLLQESLTKDVTISSREERKLKRQLCIDLENLSLSDCDTLSDTFVDMGVYRIRDSYMPLLHHTECSFIMQTCYEVSGILRNIRNMEIAVGRASKILYALKSYSHTTHTETPVETDIADSIDTVLALYHNNIKQGTELIKSYTPVPMIKCMPDELNQVWTNLIHNALQAMDYKGVLEIAVMQQQEWLVVTITDTGVGISPTLKDRIFEPFFTTKRQGEGSGLGLGIVKKIIDKHKGTIEFESIPGKTTFIVKLPIH